MDALVIHAAGDLRVEDVPTPATGPGELRIRVRFGGICGSDLHYYQHGGFGTVRVKEPMVLGHEVAHIANGDMVTLTLIQGVVNTFVVFFARVVGYFVWMLGAGVVLDSDYVSAGRWLLVLGAAIFAAGVWQSARGNTEAA